ncbi:phospho-glucose isomerase C-terminal SIS domain-containing protein [Streptoalloteichus tenebrarius]|uniref:Phospho-glucose isomerase C-terminal SIS domain-containing protein n=1 Tax=Streptoalloteichus tenebrarius (strain ATCC 17920 / DSM 40477 / JCM 4838 / CBS 697.72 / NBRC 16177 / NCIMB 11028 / NRRL B-12390 / A12253. 1 / ISP 5477) TaxID=1933 RepID=Q4PPB4_STRSD|nr:SIS domain-containing protein [Streptoalloteichus tenebrarius]AAY59890.1 TobH [Streptoalloteichus tenebrarius]MCP2258668.1 phospho-glucose isomerase C-terminal SIS domain-containing protein [Streptoalloteichus tenebrarius]BFF02812.1 hypothetical protein GCM10020241_44870 [Streptoalloteichus tenebrarius]
MLDDSLLDDPDRLAEADTGGLLRAAAGAGAQVRSTVESAAEAGLDAFGGERPRALVLVTRPGAGATASRLLAAMLGPSCPVPVVLSDAAPSWVGALDAVVAHTDDPGDAVLAESVDLAARRGCRVLLTAPAEGPVAAAAAGQAVLLAPRVPSPTGLTFSRAFAGGLLAVNALGLLRTDLSAVADELDREAERNYVAHESLVNPAKALALRLAERTPLLWGLDPAATTVAGHAADALAGFAGVVADAAGYPQAMTRPVLHRTAVRAGSGEDLFADPDEVPSGRPRVLLLAVRRGAVAEAARRAAADTLPGADVVAVPEEVAGDEAVCAAVLASRFDTAALYLGLALGTLGGPGVLSAVVD